MAFEKLAGRLIGKYVTAEGGRSEDRPGADSPRHTDGGGGMALRNGGGGVRLLPVRNGAAGGG